MEHELERHYISDIADLAQFLLNELESVRCIKEDISTLSGRIDNVETSLVTIIDGLFDKCEKIQDVIYEQEEQEERKEEEGEEE